MTWRPSQQLNFLEFWGLVLVHQLLQSLFGIMDLLNSFFMAQTAIVFTSEWRQTLHSPKKTKLGDRLKKFCNSRYRLKNINPTLTLTRNVEVGKNEIKIKEKLADQNDWSIFCPLIYLSGYSNYSRWLKRNIKLCMLELEDLIITSG